MNPKLKSILINSAKQAVNAAIITLVPIYRDPQEYNLHSWAGIQHVAVMVVAAIMAREILVWGPKVLAWSQSTGDTGISISPGPVELQKPEVKQSPYEIK